MLNLQGIYVIWLRELIRFWREKLRIVTTLVQPVVWLFVVGSGLGRSFSGPGGIDYTQFMFPGIIGMTLLFTSIFSAISIVWDREFGFLKEIMIGPVSRTSIVVGKALSGSTTSVIQGLLILLLAPVVGITVTLPVFFTALGVMFLMSFSLSSLGILIAARMDSMQGFNLVMNFLVMPMFFLSGAIFPLTGLPAWMYGIAVINPLAYAVDALKHILIGIEEFSFVADISVVAGLAVVTISGAVFLFNQEG